MCGINGFTGSSLDSITKMNNAISHRGPDGVGVFSDEHVSLGHVRLAVVDLSQAGHQPMAYERKKGASSDHYNTSQFSDSRYVLTYNGEIYNYREVRTELEELGFVFSTQTDSEVIIAAYDQWGPQALHKFNGMWAFCIYDKQEQVLFLSRDRFGQKPLYYTQTSGQLVFSSEMKGLLAHEVLSTPSNNSLDTEAVQLYFALGFVPAPRTIFSNINKLEAGHYIQYDLKTKKLTDSQYYELPVYEPVYQKQVLCNEGEKLLQSAAALRMRADVPVGSFLSGGLDSSGVTQEIVSRNTLDSFHTFSVGFEGPYDETKYIDEVRSELATDHHHVYFTEDDFTDMVKQHGQVYDEPYGSPSSFPTRMVSHLAREHVTVALSGDGGDEVFGGYSSHIIGRQLELLRKLPNFMIVLVSKYAPFYKIKTACKIVLGDHARMRIVSQSKQGYSPKVFEQWSEEKMNYALKKAQGNLSEAARIYDVLFFTLPDDFLVKVDRASMAHALEVRSPFMDYRMMEFGQKIPTSYKVSLRGSGKLLLKKILSSRLPHNIVYRKKQGFTPPIEQWITQDVYRKELFEFVENVALWDKELCDLYKNRYLKNNDKVARTFQIRLLMFKKWHEHWVA